MRRKTRPTLAGGLTPRATPDWYRPRFEVLESRYLLSLTSAVIAQHVFYQNSVFDDAQFGFTDDSAIATDKSAYLPGSGLSTSQNMTSYSRGLNGIMVDISGSHPSLTAADFDFRVGANNSPGTWAGAPAPASFLVRPGEGASGSDRVVITWLDNQIQNTWLAVTVSAGENTGLPVSETFFFGNIIGDTFSDNQPTFLAVDATDQVESRNNQGQPADLTNPYDFDRDAIVDATDQIIARFNQGFQPHVDAILIPPSLSAGLTVDTGPNGTPNTDTITTDARVSGTLNAANGVSTFLAGLNAGPVSFDAAPFLSGSNFTLTVAFLETMNGGPLADGTYTVHLRTVDSFGLSAAANTTFTLKTSIATPALPDLIAADDTGTSSVDNITKITTPRVDVVAETGSLVRLLINNIPTLTGTGGPGLQFTLPTLAAGNYNIKVTAEDGAGNLATSATLPIQVATALPTITSTTLVTISTDLTPHVTVTASSPLALANGTLVTVDVDLNYDGDYDDAGEMNRTTSPLYNGKSYFQVTPALPHDVGGAAYNVQIRARVTDLAGNQGTSTAARLKIDSVENTVLEDYVIADPEDPPDPNYTWSLHSSGGGTGFAAYNIDMKSQVWRSLSEVNKILWQHWVQIYVPNSLTTNTATLFIDGGSNSGSPPGIDANLGLLAVATGSVLVRLRNVPNEPLTFAGEGFSRTEDEIIAYTFDKYRDNLGAPGNESWPLLLPMVKSAVRTMDTAQSFIPTVVSGGHIDDFLVTGYSKRGWTTWLTAAMDDRVRAIVPGVIDILNMGEQMVHHYGAYTDFSFAIDDYTAFNIPQDSYTIGGQEIGRVVDPYTYINNGRFDDMPKLLINSSGDEFFLPDAAEFYFSDLPGTDNYLRYIPNTGHGLNTTDPAFSTIAFFSDVVSGTPLPEFSWTVEQDGSIVVQTVDTPNSVTMWQATNPTTRDFRRAVNPTINWTSSTLSPSAPNTYTASVATPGAGARAFFVQLNYPSSSGVEHIFTTQIKVLTNTPLSTWAFTMPTIPPPAAPLFGEGSGESGDADAVAFALAASAGGELADAALAPPALAPAIESAPAGPEVDLVITGDWSWVDTGDDGPAEDDADDEAALLLLADDWL
jgi:PhoPQ-activated pathogenicity-related protein